MAKKKTFGIDNDTLLQMIFIFLLLLIVYVVAVFVVKHLMEITVLVAASLIVYWILKSKGIKILGK